MEISAIILAKDEEQMIEGCLKTLPWVDEIIVVDDNSTDQTPSICKKYGAKIIRGVNGFAANRNAGMEAASGNWLLYVDADERVSAALADEIMGVIKHAGHSSYAINRINYQIGKKLIGGGWGEDKIIRLFKKTELEKWAGKIHEHAIVNGSLGQLKAPLYHLTHRSVLGGLSKSVIWTNIEAEQLHNSNHPKITRFRLIKVVFSELFKRLVAKKGYRDGDEGWIEAMIQAMNRFIVYTRLWELQQSPSLKEKYSKIEEEIEKEWKTK